MSIREKQVTENLPEYPAICELLKTAFPKEEQEPEEHLLQVALKKGVDFRAFYDEEQFFGILYTIESEKYMFVLYLAISDKIRSRGYGGQIIQWLKNKTSKTIVLNVEIPDPSAENYLQRKKRIAFYRRNGITDTGYSIVNKKKKVEPMAILSSDSRNFDVREYNEFLNTKVPDTCAIVPRIPVL